MTSPDRSDCPNPPASIRRVSHQLLQDLETSGYQARLVPVERLNELRVGIQRHLDRGELDRELQSEYLTAFDFTIPTSLPEARTIVLIAAPQPHVRLTVTRDGRELPVIIPPTYSTRVDGQVREILLRHLEPSGFQLWRHPLPVKLLAVRTGLAEYGKNNLTYVTGMGSYQRLIAFYTDLPGADAGWVEPQAMAQCESCTACERHCPTGAITPDRFLIQAERCLTLHNERERDFPDWIDPRWHHCLIGCLCCQASCPVNQGGMARIEAGPAFTAAETDLLLEGVPREELSPETLAKLEEFGLADGMAEVARNLRALLDSPDGIERGLAMARGKMPR